MGQLIRLLLLGIAIWLAVSLFRRLLASIRSTRRDSPGKTPPAHGVPMVPCAHCGVFVPRDEAVSARGRQYCSAQHADADHRP